MTEQQTKNFFQLSLTRLWKSALKNLAYHSTLFASHILTIQMLEAILIASLKDTLTN